MIEIESAVVGHRATIVTLVYTDGTGRHIRSTGEAIKHPTDKFEERTGIELAMARAFESLSRRLHRRADGYVKCQEDNRIHSERSKAQREALQRRAAENGKARVPVGV